MNTDDTDAPELKKLVQQLARLPEPPVPSERMRTRFRDLLAIEENTTGRVVARPRRFHLPGLLRLAAALAIGVTLGAYFFTPHSPTPAELELARLRAQLSETNRIVTQSLLQQKNTGDRLQAVLATLQEQKLDSLLLTDLVGTLTLDPSPNVRLSAAEALARHTDQPLARAGLRAALQRENSPSVQTLLINALANAHDTAAIPVLTQLGNDTAVADSVRDTARRAAIFLRQNSTEPPPKSILL